MYDGSTSMAEAFLMAQRVTRRDKIVVAETVHPEYLEVAKTYTQHGDTEIETVGFDAEIGRVSDVIIARRQDRRACRSVAEFLRLYRGSRIAWPSKHTQSARYSSSS